MNMETSEKLIQLVRKNKCLYDLKHKHYRHIVYKLRLWEKIAQELNMTSTAAKQKWKVLRDGYVKYKKHLNGKTEAEKQDVSFIWAEKLSFLEGMLRPRQSATTFAGPVPAQTHSPSESDYNPESYPAESYLAFDLATPSTYSSSHPNHSYDACMTSSSFNQESLSSFQQESLRTTPPLSHNRKERESDFDTALNEMKSKTGPTHDGIDYLFQSYAKTLKTFSVPKQSEIKIKLAIMFAEAELSEYNKSQQHNTVLNIEPAAYSVKTEKSQSDEETRLLTNATTYEMDSVNLSSQTN